MSKPVSAAAIIPEVSVSKRNPEVMIDLSPVTMSTAVTVVTF